MASTPSGEGNPASSDAADYDHAGGGVDRTGLVDDLESLTDGDVRFDSYSRQLYATDASIYEAAPIGVVFPASTADVSAVVEYCAGREIPVLPRGGGTSLAGQTVNEAVVLDFTRYMDDVASFDADARRARAQAGVYVADLNAAVADAGLKFAPDPAWRDKSTLGGALGNNSTGAHSLKYGKTDAYVESCEVVLADGTVTTFGEVTVEELRKRGDPDGDLEARIHAAVASIIDEDADIVDEVYPDMKRNVSGYNLDVLVDEARNTWDATGDIGVDDGDADTVNLARLLAGSEGTLAIATEVAVSLVPVPETKAVALLTYDSLGDAMEDVVPILEHDPAAVEVMDDVFLDLAADTDEFSDVVDRLPERTDSTLLVEFYADGDAAGRRKVADLVADRVRGGAAAIDSTPSENRYESDAPVRAVDALEAHDEHRREQFWKMRKAGLPILLSRTSDAKHISFIEDAAVPPEHLPEYVEGFRSILDDHNTFASFYAHAGPGVLHIRPLVDTKTVAGVEQMESIADAVTDLVVEFGGSVSGEHGDGRARTQWNRKLYGEEIWQTFRELKTAFDPDWILNPGQVCGDVDMTRNLRFDPDYDFDTGFDPVLNWDNENGFRGMAELCHGCGGCRGPQETTGGVMCPTYRASEEEITSTRGRANALRQAMSGDLPADPTSDEFATEVIDLCIGCKGCKRDCPSGVDMAKLKSEVVHERHQREGAGLRDRLFANFDALAGLASATAPLANAATKLPGVRTVMEKTVGIASERSLPSFERTTVQDWFDARGGSQVAAADADREAVLFVDTYTNYTNPAIGKAAVRVLEAAGVRVVLADSTDSGRPAHSKGFLGEAAATARENVRTLGDHVTAGRDVVAVEPSDAVMFQSDYLDLLGPGAAADHRGSGEERVDVKDVHAVAANAYGICEYLDAFRLDDGVDWSAPEASLTYHGHCHQKATKKDHHAVGVLRRAGYDVDPLDSGCCGMAGTFGYEAEHYSMSRAIGDILFDQLADSDGDIVVAPGASCRTQLGDRDGVDGKPPHPVELLEEAI